MCQPEHCCPSAINSRRTIPATLRRRTGVRSSTRGKNNHLSRRCGRGNALTLGRVVGETSDSCRPILSAHHARPSLGVSTFYQGNLGSVNLTGGRLPSRHASHFALSGLGCLPVSQRLTGRIGDTVGSPGRFARAAFDLVPKIEQTHQGYFNGRDHTQQEGNPLSSLSLCLPSSTVKAIYPVQAEPVDFSSRTPVVSATLSFPLSVHGPGQGA